MTDLKTHGVPPRFIPYLLAVVVALLAAVVAVVAPYWWAEVPVVSLFGILSWKRNYFVGVIVAALYGFVLWVAQLLLLPQTPLQRIVTAVAGIEGLPPTVFFYLGPILMALTCALGAATVAGLGLLLIDLRVRPAPAA